MRIIALSDIHGSFAKVEEILAQTGSFDLLLVAGDLTTCGTPKEVEKAFIKLQIHNKPILSIAGNMDSPEIDEMLVSLNCSINLRGVIIEDVGFFGVSAGPISPLHTPYEISEEMILQSSLTGWNDIKSARWKIFIPHAPPSNTKLDRTFFGAHVGSTAVREFIERSQPDVVVCGHIHESRGIDILGKSKMVNCGPAEKGYYAVIEIGNTIQVKNYG